MANQVEIADFNDIQRVLKETFEIWSPGLSRERYADFIFKHLNHPWARSNYEYLILRDARNSPTPAASLKYYKLDAVSRGKRYALVGLGAIYTRKDLRGEGYGTEIIRQAIEKAWQESCHGMILFSDIPKAYYERFGFAEVSNEKFVMTLNPVSTASVEIIKKETTGDTSELSTVFSIPDHDAIVECHFLHADWQLMDYLVRQYERFLRRRPFGIERSSTYFHFKISKENYLAEYSCLAWPKLELLTVDWRDKSGYAIIEYGGAVVRILELVGDEETRSLLWRGVVARARDLDALRISGWESIIADLSPGFSRSQLATIDDWLLSNCSTLMFSDKVKGRCMILPLDKRVEEWLYICPCPVLELDHL